MLNKKLGVNSFELIGLVSEVGTDQLTLNYQAHNLRVQMHDAEAQNLMVGSSIKVLGAYHFVDNQPCFTVSEWHFFDSEPRLSGYIEGEVIKFEKMGDERKPWAKVLIKSNHRRADNNSEVTSSICLVNISGESLKTIDFDLYKGDRLGVNVLATNNDVELTWKVSKIRLHYPHQILTYFNSEQYVKDRLGGEQ